jgi:hypothetical protein
MEAAVATTEQAETAVGLRRNAIGLRVVEVGLVHLDPLEEYPSE